MKTLLALLFGTVVMAIASMSPAAAKDSSPLRCLVLDNFNSTKVVDVCKCARVVVPVAVKDLLKRDPVRVAALCPFVNNGGGGGQSADSSDESPHGHGFSFSKGSSSSSFVGVAVGGSTPFAITILGEHTTSVAIGDGGATAGAGSNGSAVATGAPSVGTARLSGGSSTSSTSATNGSTGGGSCAGSSCGGSPPSSTQY
jgi:hypothetical protein